MATIYTVGHSTCAWGEFLSLLRHYGLEVLADVRTYPSSRRFPHFDQAALARALAGAGIEYLWLKALGGRRHGPPDPDSPNPALRSPAFRNYADHMCSDEFRRAADRLRLLARERRVVVMCAERLYWRCHRRLLADYLTAQGEEVLHLESVERLLPHRLTPGARIGAGTVTYPAPEHLF